MKERIKEIRKNLCNGSNEEFAKKVGESQQTVSNWTTRGVGIGSIKKILQAFKEVDRNWLFDGEGEMLKSETPINGGVLYESENSKLLRENGRLKDRIIELQDEIIQLERKPTAVGASDAPARKVI